MLYHLPDCPSGLTNTTIQYKSELIVPSCKPNPKKTHNANIHLFQTKYLSFILIPFIFNLYYLKGLLSKQTYKMKEWHDKMSTHRYNPNKKGSRINLQFYNHSLILINMQEVQEQQYLKEVDPKSHLETKDFNNHFPAVQITSKHYSLDADIATGWRPKVRMLGPIPLNFDLKIVDEIVDQLTSFGRKYKERVIYLGHRFQSSFKMHLQIKRQYEFKYQGIVNSNYLHMAAYFRKFHSNFKSKTSRIFKGMNPTIPKNQQLMFDSIFQSGNLDACIKINQNQYDLFMRADSNTRGHTQWFNFTIKNCGKKKIKLNIINFKKCKTMYSRGMKPYVFSSYLSQFNQGGWIQGGDNVKFQRKILSNYKFLEEYYTEEQMTFNILSFHYEFSTDWEEVQFAYAPPFTYSDNAQMIRNLRVLNRQLMKISHSIDNYMKEEVLTESLGGLEIPLLTITDPTVESKKKRCIVLSGRIHPGEPCGSYMMKGFLNFILSDKEEAKYLRENIVFKVIPMINPDGVTIGNFRTSLCGKDLNRTFKLSNDLLIPQVKGLKDLVINLKQEWKNRLIMFFDLHGHSVKKNVFLYGPEYQIWQPGYYKTRIFPKLLADSTQMFRYYSCLFRIAQFKKTTARAVILKNIPHCYTIEASTGFFYSQEEKKDIPFTTDKYEFMGEKIAQTLRDYLQLLYDQEQTRLERKQKISQLKMLKSNRVKSKKQNQRQIGNKTKFQTRKIQNPALTTKQGQADEQNPKKQPFSYMSQKARQIIEKIKKEEEEEKFKNLDEGHQSDKFSEGGSDSESESDDLNQDELNKLHEDIIDSMREFREKIGIKDLKNNRNFSFKQQPKKKVFKQAKPKVEVIASLRGKVQKLQQAKIKQLKQLKQISVRPIRQDIKLQKIKPPHYNSKQSNTASVKPSIKSSIARLEELQIEQNDNKQFEDYREREFHQNPSKPFLNKISMGQLSFMAKSRLYSLMENHENEPPKGEMQKLMEQDFYLNAQNELYVQNNKEFEDLQKYIRTHDGSSKVHENRWSASSSIEGPNHSEKNGQMAIKYASQLPGRSLTSKLKKVFETNQTNNLVQSSNFVASSSLIDRNNFNAGLNLVKFDSTKLN